MDHERPVAEVDPRGGRWVYEKGASKDAGTAGSSLKGRISEGLFYRLGGHTGDSNSTKPAATAVRRTGYTSWQWEAPASYRSGDGFCGLLAAGQHARLHGASSS
ncbi:hypothetical protein H633G_10848 [Metarhizium anisopliae BRIP 53284]|nr:hypothetical protein H633G_10848 [Metarhizium anisopliae BRIP 53284]